MRVVSLLPSATEMCYALGVEPVGVSHECDYPQWASDQPSVVHSRVDPTATSGELDSQVQQAVETGGVYELDEQRLAELAPDVIVSQGICDVCAIDVSHVRQTVSRLGLDAQVVASDPQSLEDVFADLKRLGDVLNVERTAQQVIADLQKRVDALEGSRSIHAQHAQQVAILDWTDPVMVAGHWIPGMVEHLGATYPLATPGAPSRPREFAEIRRVDPDILVISPCGFDCEQTLANRTDLTDREGWSDLTAVTNERAYIIDGNQYVNRPGPRLVETLELLGSVIQNDVSDCPSDAVQQFPTVETLTS